MTEQEVLYMLAGALVMALVAAIAIVVITNRVYESAARRVLLARNDAKLQREKSDFWHDEYKRVVAENVALVKRISVYEAPLTKLVDRGS